MGTIGTAYVRGLQSAGVDATLKHFVGYSASRAGRNHAPVSMGIRELQDILLPPFEMAVKDGGVRSVMNSYADIDGVPIAATSAYLGDILRDRWGFDGVVVSDYFAVMFLHSMHAVAEDAGAAAALALEPRDRRGTAEHRGVRPGPARAHPRRPDRRRSGRPGGRTRARAEGSPRASGRSLRRTSPRRRAGFDRPSRRGAPTRRGVGGALVQRWDCCRWTRPAASQ